MRRFRPKGDFKRNPQIGKSNVAKAKRLAKKKRIKQKMKGKRR